MRMGEIHLDPEVWRDMLAVPHVQPGQLEPARVVTPAQHRAEMRALGVRLARYRRNRIRAEVEYFMERRGLLGGEIQI